MTEEKLIIEPTESDQESIRGYKIGMWGRHNRVKNYSCIYCQYSTLWLSKMVKHQAADNHPWAFPGQNVKPEGQAREYDEPEY